MKDATAWRRRHRQPLQKNSALPLSLGPGGKGQVPNPQPAAGQRALQEEGGGLRSPSCSPTQAGPSSSCAQTSSSIEVSQ